MGHRRITWGHVRSMMGHQYLDKYGWTEPVNWEDLAYQGVSVPLDNDPPPMNVSGLLLEGHYGRRQLQEQQESQQMLAKYTSALLRFQKANGLPASGVLDQATKEAMNMPRCGVPDHKAHDNDSNVLNTTRMSGLGYGLPPDPSRVGATSLPSSASAHPTAPRCPTAGPSASVMALSPQCPSSLHRHLPTQGPVQHHTERQPKANPTNQKQQQGPAQPTVTTSRRQLNQSENSVQSQLNQSGNNDKSHLNQWQTTSQGQLNQSETSGQGKFNQSSVGGQGQLSGQGGADHQETSARPMGGGERAEHGSRRRTIRWLVEQMRRRRAASDLLDNTFPQLAFTKSRLRWRILDEGYSSQLTIDDQKMILRLAFRMWSEVTPLIFIEDLTSPASEIDIKLGFGTSEDIHCPITLTPHRGVSKQQHAGTGQHPGYPGRGTLGCSQVFDGNGQEYAHAWRLGDVHFDDDEHFVKPSSSEGISLLTVAVHEIGHVLGLPHIRRPGSIMHPNYIPQESKDLELDWYDRKAIQQIYGVCEGSFNTVFDWVRQEENEFGEVTYRFNTYFMRHGWYWMYENRFNRTRYGDPIPLVVGWRGLPSSDIDGFVHIWTWNRDITLFFKGTLYWQYDNDNDRVYSEDPQGNRFPRPIAQAFPGIEGPIDTVYFDKRDHCLYLLQRVTAFSVDLNATVPGYPKRIIDVFPPIVKGNHPLGHLDAAYYSYTHTATFIFKDTVYWRVINEEDRENNASLPLNGLLPHHRIAEHWHDICEVDGSWAPGRQ
ncbi:LOW QUALITY PROTEIN: matrix metalloproteinase-21-like [Pristis pectinata]|uniref:LOW QUALITY PROTEIN: matrix metalloproteinase-21-like n=1 Tax=Pristis pectinata TaxID=685728 RepID=UPI00223CDBCC|nr:LOW QUALITY PROTEIN: matrix metalloproteinase-21-like [Pristis pectinata]